MITAKSVPELKTNYLLSNLFNKTIQHKDKKSNADFRCHRQLNFLFIHMDRCIF